MRGIFWSTRANLYFVYSLYLRSALIVSMNAFQSFFRWAWESFKFHISPWDVHFTEMHWYGYQYYKRLNYTIYKFLDNLVFQLRSDVDDPRVLRRKKISNEFLTALYDPRLRKEIVAYFDQAPITREDSLQLWRKIRSRWRMEDDEVPAGAAVVVVTEAAAVTAVEEITESPQVSVEDERVGEGPVFHAKTYVIAAHISFELAGKEAEFDAFSQQLFELGNFIKAKFGVRQLPGTFSKLKGYSYKRVLKDKNISKKGQLKPCLRQIIDHPEVFGDAVSQQAQQLLDANFEE